MLYSQYSHLPTPSDPLFTFHFTPDAKFQRGITLPAGSPDVSAGGLVLAT